MPIGPSDFKDLLEAYFLIKNAPDKGSKKDKLDDVKMEIYDSYLNEDFGDERERPPNASAAESKVMKEFFMEVDKFEKKYMDSAQITSSEIAKESNGHALACGIEFTQNCKRFVLIKEELRGVLVAAFKKKSKKSKRRRKSKNKKSKKRKSKKKKSNRKKKKRSNKKNLKGGMFSWIPELFLKERSLAPDPALALEEQETAAEAVEVGDDDGGQKWEKEYPDLKRLLNMLANENDEESNKLKRKIYELLIRNQKMTIGSTTYARGGVPPSTSHYLLGISEALRDQTDRNLKKIAEMITSMIEKHYKD